MSFWTNILHWALKAVQSDAVKTAGVQALQDATTHLVQVAQQHAPDVAAVADPLLQQYVTQLVAGITTKTTGGK